MSIQAIFVNHPDWNQGRVFIGPACFDRASAFIIATQTGWDDNVLLYSTLEEVLQAHDDWTFEDAILDPDDEKRVAPQEGGCRVINCPLGLHQKTEATISTDLRERDGLKDERGAVTARLTRSGD